MVRYRFFLYAGLLPYGLGAAWAYATTGTLDGPIFWSGLAGVVLAVIGVEAFNEYFDSRMGTDRVFNPADLPPMSSAVMWLGIAAFAGALAVGIYLAVRGGWPILAFAWLGGMAAIFYVAPPIRWAYRGLGELVIALSYGPWMVLGSVYLLHRRAVRRRIARVVGAGVSHHVARGGERDPRLPSGPLVGKRNLVVRLGRRRAVALYVRLATAGLAVVPVGVVAGVFPPACLAALLAAAAARLQRAPGQPLPTNRRASSCPPSAASCAAISSRWSLFIGGHSACRLAVRMNRRVDDLRGAAVRFLAAHPRLRSLLSSLLHRVGAGEATARTSSTPARRCAWRTKSSAIDVPYVMLCGGEPLVVPHFLAVAEALGNAGVELKIETNGQRFDAAVAARLAATADPLDPDQPRWRYPGNLRAPAPRRFARQGACRLPRRAGRRTAARSDLRADAAQHPRGSRRDRAGACPRSLPFQYREADAHRHRRAPVGPARARRGSLPDVPSAPLHRRGSALARKWNSAMIPFDIEDALRESLADPPATMLVLPNGWVKVAAALPYICADLRRTTLAEAWEAYRCAWRTSAVTGATRPRDRR